MHAAEVRNLTNEGNVVFSTVAPHILKCVAQFRSQRHADAKADRRFRVGGLSAALRAWRHVTFTMR